MSKFWYWVITFFVIIGCFTSLKFIFNIGQEVWAKIDHNYSLELDENRYDELSKKAYSYGRLWGAATAPAYESGSIKGFEFVKPEKRELAVKIAENIFLKKGYEFNCWGPNTEDCQEFPSDQRLKSLYNVNYGSPNMPINSFRSGFTDGFIEYFEPLR